MHIARAPLEAKRGAGGTDQQPARRRFAVEPAAALIEQSSDHRAIARVIVHNSHHQVLRASPLAGRAPVGCPSLRGQPGRRGSTVKAERKRERSVP
jgi:hypothetical protein